MASASWSSAYDGAKQLVEEVASLVQERSTQLREGGSDAPRLAAAAHRKLATLASQADELGRTIADGDV